MTKLVDELRRVYNENDFGGQTYDPVIIKEAADEIKFLRQILQETLDALAKLTTACAMNAVIMNSINLSVFEEAVEIEQRLTEIKQ